VGNCNCLCSGCLFVNLSDHKTIKVMRITHFIVYFILFTISLAITPLVFQFYYPAMKLLIPKFWALFWIFAILTLSIYLIASWRMRISDKASGQALLGSVTTKLIFCMIIAFVYINANSVDPLKFIINFFYLYFFHTVFEIYCLLCNLRNQKFK
jgi:hypothetical protein